ncbi:hypothetical protein EXU48_03400 [Occultella glacieicola]|uniref:PH domain-containing protein n=1 Tax=Occultella glacieicola TaxID=2518684 RepID=A0ABY2E6U2_9MICO|nr:hypothetical protein [Occultella glacieicola]TDE97267.1 hypothetical protein EXU48_03400 [Occultella glacieicola]
MFTMFSLVMVSDAAWPGYVGYPVLITGMLGFFGAIGTAQVYAQDDDLVITDVIIESRIPRSLIVDVEWHDGITVHLFDSRSFEPAAYGSSLLQAFLVSRRLSDAGRAMRAWVDGDPGDAVDGRPVRRRLRRWWTTAVPSILVVALAWGVILWWLTPILRPIVVG